MALLLRAGHGKAARSKRYKKLSPQQARAVVKAADKSVKAKDDGETDFVVKLFGTEAVTFRSQKVL